MNKEQILEFLRKEEQELWKRIETSELVFGKDSEAVIRAKTRWATTMHILNTIEDEENK